ncbi:MAG: hypothetical protein ACFFE4_02065, partial [Candidatus Thorarchaeota archaeon]
MSLLKVKKFGNNHIFKMKVLILIILIFFTLTIPNLLVINQTFNADYSLNTKEKPKTSWFWATLDLTNPSEINNSLFTHYTSISVKGRLYNKISGENKSGYNVAIEVDDVVDMGYTDQTDPNGQFDINYVIDGLLDIYTSHKIEVVVTDNEPGGPGSEVEYPHFYIIYVNATSYFDIDFGSTDDPNVAKLTGEDFNIVGSLKYDNGQGIPFVSVNYYWYEGPSIISQGSFFTDLSGSLTSLQVPNTVASYLTLKLNFTNPPYVGYAEEFISDLKVFSDVNYGLIVDYLITEGDTYHLTGTLSSITDSSIKIGNRNLDIIYNGTVMETVTLQSDGTFSSSFTVPMQNGTATI